MTDGYRWEPSADEQRGPGLIRQPLRLALTVGGGLAVIGSFVSWADGVLPGQGAVSFSPVTSADGVILPILAVAAIVIGLSEGAAESRTRTIQAALAVIGVIAVLIWISAYGSAAREIDVWLAKRGSGAIGAGIWLAAAGVALIAVSGSILSIRAWRANGAGSDPGDVVTRRSVVRAVVEVACGVAGLAGGIALGLAPMGPGGLALMAFGSILGGAAGLAVGNRIGRLI